MQYAVERIVCRQTTIAMGVLRSGAPDLPVALFLHGAQRSGGVMLEFARLFADRFDVAACDLPGDGESEPLLDVSLDDFALEIVHLLLRRFPGRPILLLGESIGGVIAMRVAADPRVDIRWLVLVDPPLTTAKQWHIRQNSVTAMARDPGSTARRLFSSAMFGVHRGDRQDERIYYDLFDDLTAPCLILTGDFPLHPVRQTGRVMCCMDETDTWVIQTRYRDKALVARVGGAGHLMLMEQAATCLQAILHFVDTHPLQRAAA